MLDTDNWRYIGKNKTIELTYKENEILAYIIEHKERIVTYEELMKIDAQKYINKKSSYVAIARIINRLRQKLAGELRIKTRTSLGFYL